MKSQEFREKRQTALDAAKAIRDAAAEADRDLTEEEDAQIQAHLDEAAQAKADAEAAEKIEQDRADRLARLDAELEDANRVQEPIVRPSIAPQGSTPRSNPRITGGEASGEFAHIGEYFFKVREAALSPSITDRRLRPAASAPGMQEGTDSLGGFLVPVQYTDRILDRMYSTGELLSRVKAAGMHFPLQRNSIKLPRVDESSRADGSRSGAVRGYWVGEHVSITDGYPKVGEMTLTLHKAAALGYITDEMLEDAPASGAFLEKKLTDDLIFTVENSLVNGTGGNKPVGILNANCGVNVTKETNQTADTIWGPNVTKMWARMFAACRSTAVWLVNQSCEPFLFSLTLEGRYGSASTSAEGIPLYYPAGSLLNQGKYGILMGRPVIATEYNPVVGTVGDLMLWDPASYVLVDKAGGPRAASSIHVQFLTEQTTFRVSYRVDGQPTWESALTPYDAGDTLSCIVRLASRD